MMTLKLAAVAMMSTTVFLLFLRALWVLAEAPWADNGTSVIMSMFVGGCTAALWWINDGH